MNEHFETFSRFLHYLALYVNQMLKCNYKPIDFYSLVNPTWLVWQDELQRRRLFRLLLRLRRRGAAPRCFQQHPLISKASSATANTLPDIQHKDTGVCLSQAQQQMMLKDGNSSEQERGSVAKKGEQPQERGVLAQSTGTGVHTSTLVWITTTLEADLLTPSLHAVIPIMEQHMNSIPARCRQAGELLSLQLQALGLHEAQVKPSTCRALIYRLAAFEPHL